jgi:soluble lytic murein transglycosylase-like protein
MAITFGRTWLHVAIVALIALRCGAVAAQTQIYASPAVGDAAVVLSNFASKETPVLLLSAPAASTEARPIERVPAGVSRVPADIAQIIESVAREVGVSSRLLHAVIAVESNFDRGAVSPKGALGLMQVMPATARRFGVNDMMSARENVRAGALYLRWLAGLFDGDLELVLAAYNAGEQSVLDAGRRIPRIAETQAYVPRVLARLGCATRTSCTSVRTGIRF